MRKERIDALAENLVFSEGELWYLEERTSQPSRRNFAAISLAQQQQL
ncbi:MAG: hypothetical protein ACLUKN_04820 [Bacilli bacterium]